MDIKGMIIPIGLAIALGFVLGLLVRGAQITTLEITATGLRATVQNQQAGLQGLGHAIECLNGKVCP